MTGKADNTDGNGLFAPHPFWSFSLETYGRPEIGSACLKLQEKLGVDVNLLLLCVWWSAQPRPDLDRETFGNIVERADAWHREVVLVMRAARRACKAGAASLTADEAKGLHRHVLASEIECEHGEQLIIARTAEELTAGRAPREDGRLAALHSNLRHYFTLAGIRPDRDDLEELERVTGCSFTAW